MICQWEGKGKKCEAEAQDGRIFCEAHKTTPRFLGVVCSNGREAEDLARHIRSNRHVANVYQHRFVIIGPTTAPGHYFANGGPLFAQFYYEDVLADFITAGQLIQVIEPGTQMLSMLHPIRTQCPKCAVQHIDHLEKDGTDWARKPHRRHLCHNCGEIFVPLDTAGQPITYYTIGVK